MDYHLYIDSIPFFEPCLEFSNSVVRMPPKYVKVADTIFAKERTGHGTVESTLQVNTHREKMIVDLQTYFHISPGFSKDKIIMDGPKRKTHRQN